jgi:hypothetical protein
MWSEPETRRTYIDMVTSFDRVLTVTQRNGPTNFSKQAVAQLRKHLRSIRSILETGQTECKPAKDKRYQAFMARVLEVKL